MKTFKCDICGDVVEDDDHPQADQERREECKEIFGTLPSPGDAQACDKCFQAIRPDKNTPTQVASYLRKHSANLRRSGMWPN